MSDRHETEHKSFGSPDETREFPKGHAEILEVGGGEVGRLVFEPGWRWSNDVKPLANTDSCEAAPLPVPRERAAGHPHGRRHRAAVVVDWYGASNYAKGD